MSKVRWKGNRTPETIAIQVKVRRDRLKREAQRALEKSVTEGAVETQDILEAAVTRTGLRRQEGAGGLPGRHKTGNMVGSISHDGDNPYIAGPVVVASFGWFSGEFEPYFRDQDLGQGNIPAARGLAGGFTLARENFRRRLGRIVQGKSAD